jgi:DNA mismatch endonuclease (patch repair protein)
MADDMTQAQRSYTMSRIRSSGNRATEERFVQLLRKAKVTGWRRKSSLPGHPDLVFPKERVAVFLDGCFWHGCPGCYLPPKSNVDYWTQKIAGNVARDKKNTAALKAGGWAVLRIWQHSIQDSPSRVVRRVRRLLAATKEEW